MDYLTGSVVTLQHLYVNIFPQNNHSLIPTPICLRCDFTFMQECIRRLLSFLFERTQLHVFFRIDQFISLFCTMSFVRVHFAANTRNEVQRFISFDEIGTLCKLRRLRNTRKASETGCRNEDSLLCVSAPGNAYVFFEELDFRYFCVGTTTLSHDQQYFDLSHPRNRRAAGGFPTPLFFFFLSLSHLFPLTTSVKDAGPFSPITLIGVFSRGIIPLHLELPGTGCGCVYCL